MNTRHLGTVGIVASPMLLIQAARSGFDSAAPDRTNAVLGLVFLIGWACSAVGLRRLRATGAGAGGAALLGVQLVGLGLAASQQVQDFVLRSPDTDSALYRIADAAWPLSVMFMLVVGGAALASRRLSGWRRWAPSLCGLALPLLIGTMATAGRQVGIAVFGLYTTAAWALLGAAVRSTPEPDRGE
jgi:hypothetical protein